MPKRSLGGVKMSRRQLEGLMTDIRNTIARNSLPEFEFRIHAEDEGAKRAVILNMYGRFTPDKESEPLLSRSLGSLA